MRKTLSMTFLCFFIAQFTIAQEPAPNSWQITADKIDPTKYFGVTVANGMVGIISSPNPLEVKEIVLNGAFDLYGRGRVSNIMKVFSFANMRPLASCLPQALFAKKFPKKRTTLVQICNLNFLSDCFQQSEAALLFI